MIKNPMNTSKIDLRTILIIIALVLVLFVLLFAVKVPYYVNAPCRFVPIDEWSLEQEGGAGRVLTRRISNNPTRVRDFQLMQYDRQDFVKFISAENSAGSRINKGSSIGHITSSDNQIQLNELKARLENIKADLKRLSLGSKPEIQIKMRKEYEYALAAYQRLEPQVIRRRELFSNELISLEQLEEIETDFKLLELNVDVKKANWDAVITGEQEEIIGLRKNEMESIGMQISVLLEKLQHESITSPINGILLDSYDPAILCKIAAIDTMIAQIPVDELKIASIRDDHVVEIEVISLKKSVIAEKISHIGKNVQRINNQGNFIVSCVVLNHDHKISPGMTGKAKILCGKRRLWRALETY